MDDKVGGATMPRVPNLRDILELINARLTEEETMRCHSGAGGLVPEKLRGPERPKPRCLHEVRNSQETAFSPFRIDSAETD